MILNPKSMWFQGIFNKTELYIWSINFFMILISKILSTNLIKSPHNYLPYTNGSVSLNYDRYSRPNSALILTGVGFYTLPPGTYFSGDFTLVAWIYINSFGLNRPSYRLRQWNRLRQRHHIVQSRDNFWAIRIHSNQLDVQKWKLSCQLYKVN